MRHTFLFIYARFEELATMVLECQQASTRAARVDANAPVVLDWLNAKGYKPTTNGAKINGAPQCPTHNRPMQPSKHGGYFCPVKVADDDGTGKAAYCKQRVKRRHGGGCLWVRALIVHKWR